MYFVIVVKIPPGLERPRVASPARSATGEGAREKDSPRLRVHWRGVAVETFRGLNLCKSGGGPNGTRSNLHNSSARFHCSGGGQRRRVIRDGASPVTPPAGVTRRPSARNAARLLSSSMAKTHSSSTWSSRAFSCAIAGAPKPTSSASGTSSRSTPIYPRSPYWSRPCTRPH